jgi:hypothetical protein
MGAHEIRATHRRKEEVEVQGGRRCQSHKEKNVNVSFSRKVISELSVQEKESR